MTQFKVVITYDLDTAKMEMTGPKDEIVVLGMLQKAITIVSKNNINKNRIIPAKTIPTFKGGKGK